LGFGRGFCATPYVDASVASASSGDGKTIATAFKTISEAVAQSVEDGVDREIKVLAGIYRESFSLSGFQGRISGYGTDKPIVTGAEVLSGWTACTAADEAVVGPNYASIFKATLSSLDFASETPTGLNLYEDGEPLRLTQDRLGKVDLFFISYDDDFHRADSFGLDGSDQVTSITHTAVLTKHTSAQLSNAFVYLHHAPNTVSAVKITQVGSQGDTIEVDGSHPVQSTTDADRWRYSLADILPAMKAGQWGFSTTGDAVTVYAWPTSTSNLQDKIEYSARAFCINVAANMPGPITLEALDLRQPGGDGSDKDGVCIGTITSSLEKKQGLTVRHVRAGRTSNLRGGYGALYLSNIDDCTVEYVTVGYTSGCFGIFLQGRTTDPMMGAKLTHFHARYTSNAGARFYGQFLCEFSHSLLEDNALAGTPTNSTSTSNAIGAWFMGCGPDAALAMRRFRRRVGCSSAVAKSPPTSTPMIVGAGWSTSRTARRLPRSRATIGSGIASFSRVRRCLRRQPTRSPSAARVTPTCVGTSSTALSMAAVCRRPTAMACHRWKGPGRATSTQAQHSGIRAATEGGETDRLSPNIANGVLGHALELNDATCHGMSSSTTSWKRLT